MDDIFFDATELENNSFNIYEQYVAQKLGEVIKDQDFSRYIL
jgi:ATP-dependent protease HslVU (ClpYQ) ATPase subunit